MCGTHFGIITVFACGVHIVLLKNAAALTFVQLRLTNDYKKLVSTRIFWKCFKSIIVQRSFETSLRALVIPVYLLFHLG